jgi:hypothetical protein
MTHDEIEMSEAPDVPDLASVHRSLMVILEGACVIEDVFGFDTDTRPVCGLCDLRGENTRLFSEELTDNDRTSIKETKA